MDYLESVRTLSGSALDALARALYERDIKAFEEVLVRLTRLGTMRDCETIAAMLATVPLRAHTGKGNYNDARYGALIGDDYLGMYLSACTAHGCTPEEYMPVLLSAQYAKQDSALLGWDKSVDKYLTELAKSDFARTADYIDKYDKKFGKYSVLITVDREKAIDRLIVMALYGKKIDKAAVRDVLMDYEEVASVLMALYGKSDAHDRVAIVRLLLMYKNDGHVREFIEQTVKADKSKSVRSAASVGMRQTKSKNAAVQIEKLMAEGKALTYAEWSELLRDKRYNDVADKIFFCTHGSDGRMYVLVYDGGRFLDSTDRPIPMTEDRKISVLHPLDVTDDNSGILSVDISQPFLQINRPVYHASSDERYCSDRLLGTMIARDTFFANLKSLGFEFCAKRSDDEANIAVHRLGDYVIGVECDLPNSSYTVSCGKLAFYNASDVVKLKRNLYISSANAVDIRALPRRTYSELTLLAYRLFGNA